MQYADEAVVVIKQMPMKAGNRLEGKTFVTQLKVVVAPISQKPIGDAKGGRKFKVYRRELQAKVKVLKEC